MQIILPAIKSKKMKNVPDVVVADKDLATRSKSVKATVLKQNWLSKDLSQYLRHQKRLLEN